jgi:hypothetical protein
MGDKAKAREAWSRALIADPDNALVHAAQQRAGVPQLPASGTGTSNYWPSHAGAAPSARPPRRGSWH